MLPKVLHLINKKRKAVAKNAKGLAVKTAKHIYKNKVALASGAALATIDGGRGFTKGYVAGKVVQYMLDSKKKKRVEEAVVSIRSQLQEVSQPIPKKEMEFIDATFGKKDQFDITSDPFDLTGVKKDQTARANRNISGTEKYNRKLLNRFYNQEPEYEKDKSYNFKVYEDITDVRMTYSASLSGILDEIRDLAQTCINTEIDTGENCVDWKGMYRSLEEVRDALLYHTPGIHTTEEQGIEDDDDEYMEDTDTVAEACMPKWKKYMKKVNK
jgi:hypothetical protein